MASAINQPPVADRVSPQTVAQMSLLVGNPPSKGFLIVEVPTTRLVVLRYDDRGKLHDLSLEFEDGAGI